jgi:putative ABC transport system permease protein
MKFGWSRRREIDDEIRAHLRMAVEDRLARGEDPAEAERQARREFGNDLAVREATLDVWGRRRVERWLQDCRYSLRQIRRYPGFAAVAVLTLAFGIGGVAVMTAVLDSVLLRPLNYREPARLYSVVNLAPPGVPARYWAVNGRQFVEWRARCRSCEDVAMAESLGFTLSASGGPQRLPGWRVSSNFFRTLGIRPSLGRDFLPEEEGPARFRVVILSDALWASRFARDPNVIGQSIRVNDEPHVIIGVMPADFRLPVGEQWGPRFGPPVQPMLFRPLGQDFSQASPVGNLNYVAAVRLRSGVAASQAAAEFRSLVADFARQYHITLQPSLLPLHETVVRQARVGLLLLLGVVVTMLVIVCINVGNLMLVRTGSRDREVAIRMTLGSSRSQLFSLILTEALMLVLLGAAAGMALAQAGLQLFAAWAPPDLPRADEIQIGGRVWIALAVLVAVSTALCGLLPAWRMTRTDPHRALKAGSQALTADGRKLRIREWMVGLEVALSTVLLVVGGLLTLSFVRVMATPKGFGGEQVVTQDLSMSGPRFDDVVRHRIIDDAIGRLAALPGVQSVGVTNQLPLRGEAWTCTLRDPARAEQVDSAIANFRFVNPTYWTALGISIGSGRAFEDADRQRDVAVVSEGVAHALWPGENPIGKRVAACGATRPPAGLEVVGVASDVRAAVEQNPPLTIYQPYWTATGTRFYFALRTTENAQIISAEMRRVFRSIDAELPTAQPLTMEQILDESVAGRRFQLNLAIAFALFALALASLGIYGMISYAVARKTLELGIRLALGARAPELAMMVIRQGMAPVVLGLAGGAACALAAGRLVASQLYGVTPRDPFTLAGVAATLIAVGLVACSVPARRAMRINPLSAIRFE